MKKSTLYSDCIVAVLEIAYYIPVSNNNPFNAISVDLGYI